MSTESILNKIAQITDNGLNTAAEMRVLLTEMLTEFSGNTGLLNVVEDITPQLGGFLDGQGYNIVNVARISQLGVFGTPWSGLTTNTYIGTDSLLNNTTGAQLVSIGVDSGIDNTTGINNIYLGYNTGGGITTGNNNTILGSNVTGLASGITSNVILADGTGSIKLQVLEDNSITFPLLTTTLIENGGNRSPITKEYLESKLSATLGALVYKGTWNGTTNSPTMSAASSGNTGYYYVVTTSGTTNIDGITDWQLGDWVVSNGTTWEKVDNSSPIISVDGRIGIVTLGDLYAPLSASSQTLSFSANTGDLTISGGNTVNLDGRYALSGSTPITIENTSSLFSTGLLDSGLNSTGTNSIFLGNNTGKNSTAANNSNFFGVNAGSGATQSYNSNFLGQDTGLGSTNAYSSNFLGLYSGKDALNSTNSNFLGQNTGQGSSNAYNSNFLGENAGYGSTNAYKSNFLGENAGAAASEAYGSNFIGTNSGYNAYGSRSSNFIGNSAGYEALNAIESNFIGFNAGAAATGAVESNFIGKYAGYSATNASHSNFMGRYTGWLASSASYSTLLGYNVANATTIGSIGSNNIIIGTNISLSASTINSINIGGVLFGTGTYSTTTGNPSIIPNNGKIGINVVLPSEALEVGGNIKSTAFITSGGTSAQFVKGDGTLEYLSGITSGGASIIEVTKGELDILVSGDTLEVGSLYKISGVHPTLYDDGNASGTTIYLQALTTNELTKSGHGEFYNPKYDTSLDNYGIWEDKSTWVYSSLVGVFNKNELITANNGATGKLYAIIESNAFIGFTGVWSGATSITGNTTLATANISSITLTSYSISDKVIWGGYSWTNVNGNVGLALNALALNSEWTKDVYDEINYNKVLDEIEYSYSEDIIIRRREVGGSNDVTWNNFDTNFTGYDNAIRAFQFGNVYDTTNWRGVSNNLVLNSYVENINLKADMFTNNEFTSWSSFMDNEWLSSGGEIIENQLSNGSTINGNQVFSSTSINNNRLHLYANINNNAIVSGNGINDNNLEHGSINDNQVINSEVINIMINFGGLDYNKFENYTLAQFMVLRNSYFQVGIAYPFNLKDLGHFTMDNSIINVDVTGSTILYGQTSKDIYTRPDGTVRVKYYNDNDVLIIAAITD